MADKCKESNTLLWNNVSVVPDDKQPYINSIAVVKMNDNEFLVALDNHCGEGQALKYNSHLNKWSLFKRYNPDFGEVSGAKLAYNANLNTLYISSSSSCEHRWYFMESDEIYYMPVFDVPPLLVCVNGVIHGVGNFGESPTKHCICSTYVRMNALYEFPFKCISNSSLIYVRSKHKLFLIGGCDQVSDDSCEPVGIWRYNIQTNKWEKIKEISLDGCSHSATITTDEKNIIIAAKYEKCSWVAPYPRIPRYKEFRRGAAMNTIYVLNIENDDNYILRKSKINSPKMGYNNIITQGSGIKDAMLVSGYVRIQYKSEFLTYLLKYIALYYNQESLHWITKDDHFVINVKSVLC